VLSRTPLHIFSGGKTLIGSSPKTKNDFPTAVLVVGGINQELSVKKGSVFGGIEKYFSPIKTISAGRSLRRKNKRGI
jgi:hypothetical protein